MNDSILTASALNEAAQKHTGQFRKGKKREPYINHPIEVGAILAEHGAGPVTVAAGYLHDTVEDTETTHEELIRKFGENVADIVREVTDDKSLPKAERKLLQIEHAAHASAEAKQVKMADKISNLRSTLKDPPADWSDEQKLEYVEWSKKVVDNCRGVNPGLEAAFDDVYKRAKKAFQPKPAA